MSEIVIDAPAQRGKAFVAVLSCVLSRLVAANDAQPATAQIVSKFHALRPPSISTRDYLERINRYAGCSPECFVLALVYIDRLIARNGLALTSLNVHRVIITAVMLAAKFFDDQYYNNAYYAKVGGIPCVEINALELEMLFSCGFSLAVTSDVFERYFSELAGHCLAAPLDCPCDCPRSGSLLSFGPEELRYTGLRSDLVSGAVAAAAAAATVAAAAAAMGEGAGGGVPAAAGGRGAGAGRSPSDVVFSDVGDDVVTPPEPVTPEEY